jgi:glycosyltransferase involved in cell wall biosynthesis
MRFLLLNQCFYPDHVATAQHLTDLALGLVEAGHEVTVVASSRGYDNPELRYPTRETWRGVEVHRIWTPGLGKTSKWRRLVDFAVFWLNAVRILMLLPRQDVTVCLTSPPLISILGTLFARLRGGEVVPWIMDLNPDEAVAAGWLKKGGVPERVLSTLQNWSFGHAAQIIALDRFMADRLVAKGVERERIYVSAPWSHDDVVKFDAAAREAFRREHGLSDKRVVMYSGNHSPCHPLDTVLAAANEVRGEHRLQFVFVGGGSEFQKVRRFAEAEGLCNITTLPYQPKEALSGSLSAADLHLVVLGEPFVGIVHPCKVYNVLSLGLPVLCLSPRPSHLTDLVNELAVPDSAMHLGNDDLAGLVEALKRVAERGDSSPNETLRAIAARFSMGRLRPQMAEMLSGDIS